MLHLDEKLAIVFGPQRVIRNRGRVEKTLFALLDECLEFGPAALPLVQLAYVAFVNSFFFLRYIFTLLTTFLSNLIDEL